MGEGGFEPPKLTQQIYSQNMVIATMLEIIGIISFFEFYKCYTNLLKFTSLWY